MILVQTGENPVLVLETGYEEIVWKRILVVVVVNCVQVEGIVQALVGRTQLAGEWPGARGSIRPQRQVGYRKLGAVLGTEVEQLPTHGNFRGKFPLDIEQIGVATAVVALAAVIVDGVLEEVEAMGPLALEAEAFYVRAQT